jgi:hypothetical protein
MRVKCHLGGARRREGEDKGGRGTDHGGGAGGGGSGGNVGEMNGRDERSMEYKHAEPNPYRG